MSAYIGRFVFNGLAHPKYAIIRGIGVKCDLSEVIETGFGDGHPPPEFKSGKKKRGFSVKRTNDALFDDDAGRATADFFVFLSGMPFRRICRHVTASEITK